MTFWPDKPVHLAAQEHAHILLPRDGSQIEVLVDGEHGRDTIVMLPSSQRGVGDFAEVAEYLASAGFYVLRPQPRGIGLSNGRLEKLSLQTLAGDVALTIRELGGSPAVVVGHAYGHAVARVTDYLYPELIRGVVMAAAGSPGAVSGGKLPALLDIAANSHQPREARLQALRTAFFAPGNPPHTWLNDWHPELAAVYRRASRAPNRLEWWMHSNSPVLDLQGDSDPWRPPSSRLDVVHVLGSAASVAIVPHASHALFPEHPQVVAEIICQWTSQLPAAR